MAVIGFRRFRTIHPPWSGRGFIAGQAPGLLTVGGAPAARRIRVLEQLTGKVVAETVSAPDGTYRIDGLNPNLRYMVIGIDHQRVWNAAIMDNITPAVDGE